MNHFPSRRHLGCRILLALLVMWAAAGGAHAQQPGTPDAAAAFDALLKRYVKTSPDAINRVDYAGWHANAADRRALDAAIAGMAARRPSTLPRSDALAYWGNLYNAITLKVILDRYPVASIRDIKSDGWFDPKAYTGPWRQKRVTVEGRSLSLDDIEHDIMRPTFKDPRVHYVVNCASLGCPNLMPRAYKAATLDADLDAAARAFVNHPRGVRVLSSGALQVSSIYKWFIADFGGDDAGLLAHFRRYAGPELARHLAKSPAIAEDQYDWSLNEVTRPGRS